MIQIFNEDCLEGMKRIPNGSVDFILSDLPYGITDCDLDNRIPFDPMWQQFWRVTKPNAAIVLFSIGKFTIELAASQLKYYRYEWIWYKNLATGFLNAKKMPLRAHEDILVFYRKLPTYNPQFTKGKPYDSSKHIHYSDNYRAKTLSGSVSKDGRRFPRDVQTFNTVFTTSETLFSPQQKPVALLEYLIKTYTNEGETVLDATMGSGSTGVACINTNRNFIGFELEENYFNIAQKRLADAELVQ